MKIFCTNSPGILSNQFDFTDNVYDKEIVLALQYDTEFSSDDKQLLNVLNIPIIGRHRFNKMYQYLILKRFDIDTPKTYFNSNRYSTFRGVEEFDSFCEETKFIVKPILGARGIGVKQLDRKQYKELLENPKKVEQIYRGELKAQEDHSPDIDNGFVERAFVDGDMLVQEFIDVKREFRLLAFAGGRHLIYERLKEEGQLLGNLSHGSKSIEVDKETMVLLKPIMEHINYFMQSYSYPWLSIDIYIDQKGNVGVFEFQMEFAYEGFKPKEVKYAMEYAIKGFLPKNK